MTRRNRALGNRDAHTDRLLIALAPLGIFALTRQPLSATTPDR